MVASAGVSVRLAKNGRASFTVIWQTSVIERPATFTARASARSLVPWQSAHVQLVFFPLQESEKALHAFVFFFAVAFDDSVALRSGQLAERNVHRNSFRARVSAHVHRELPIAWLGPRLDRAIGE